MTSAYHPHARTNPSSSSREYSVGGKIFLLGEYIALLGKPAIVAAVGPRFHLVVEPDWEATPEMLGGFHPESPAGLLLKWAAHEKLNVPWFQFRDAHGGAGGFGGSTAEFALLYQAVMEANGRKSELNAWAAWRLYRRLTGDQALPPSGADLAAQINGGLAVCHLEAEKIEDCRRGWGSQFWVFSATGKPGRKVPTHEHLQALGRLGFPKHSGDLIDRLTAVAVGGQRALEETDLPALGRAMDDYANALSEAGLELAEAAEDRRALRALPGVLGVKGGGALLADNMMALVDPARLGPAEAAALRQTAEARGLKLLWQGIEFEDGLK
ncbi:MAG: hypothetical protein AB7P04_14760 [Bacteriovoracia bacterium]